MRAGTFDRLPPFTPAAVELGLTQMGIDAKIGPTEAVCRCFFHNDRIGGKPNLYVNISDKPGVYRCFRCSARGSFEQLVGAYMGWTTVKTALQCRKWARAVANQPPPPKPPKIAQAPQEDRLAAFRWRHPYVFTRGLTEQTAQRWEVGYDKAQDAITLPWFAPNGNLIAIKRRSVQRKYYIFEQGANLHATLFGLSHVRKQHAYLWAVEGEFDAMRLDQSFSLANLENHYAVALGGKYIHNDQITALCRREPQRVILMLDNDKAGRDAQHDVLRRLLPRVRVIEAQYPSDVHDPAGLSFEQLISLTTKIERGN